MKFIRVNAWLAVLVIAILSMVPGSHRPNVMGNGYYEHFIAYFITAGMLTVAYPRPMQLLTNCAALTILAGVLEVIQLAIPGRIASIADFAIGIIGAGVGVAVTSLITRIRGAIAARPNT